MSSRQHKYPGTRYYHYHNQNPKGRVTGDCAFRAISLGTGIPYNEVVMSMAKQMCQTGYALNDIKGISDYLKNINWYKCRQPRKEDNTKYQGWEFCEWLNEHYKGDAVICNIGGHHMVCIARHKGLFKIHDVWDSTDGCIGNWWTPIGDYINMRW